MTVIKNKGYQGTKRLPLWLTLAALTLVSCFGFDDEPDREKVTLVPAIVSNTETVIRTRGTASVTNSSGTYDDYAGNNARIKVFAVPSTGVEADRGIGSFMNYGSLWSSTVNVTSNVEYTLCGFSPTNMFGVTNSSFNWSTKVLSFPSNAIDILTDIDPLVGIAAAGKRVCYNGSEQEVRLGLDGNPVLDNGAFIVEPSAAPELTKGSLNIGTVNTAGNDNYISEGVGYTAAYKVWMALDHLYAKASVSFYVDPAYNELRDIRVKSAKLVTASGSLSGVSYTFGQGLTFTNPSFSSKNLELSMMADMPFDDGKDYVTLQVEPAQATDDDDSWVTFCFLPNQSLQGTSLTYPSDLKLVVQYEVFDKTGAYDREDKSQATLYTVENKFPLSSFTKVTYNGDNKITTSVSPKGGDYFKIKVTVKPSYLYQMFDNDAELELKIE